MRCEGNLIGLLILDYCQSVKSVTDFDVFDGFDASLDLPPAWSTFLHNDLAVPHGTLVVLRPFEIKYLTLSFVG